jgi:hypothetical protein
MISAQLSHQEDLLQEKPIHVAERIANTIIEFLYTKGTWKIEDLRAANFSYDDIARYLPEACRIVEQRPRPSQR